MTGKLPNLKNGFQYFLVKDYQRVRSNAKNYDYVEISQHLDGEDRWIADVVDIDSAKNLIELMERDNTLVTYDQSLALLKSDKRLVGTADYKGLAYSWAYAYRHYLRDATPLQRQKVHHSFLKANLELDGESENHWKIIQRYIPESDLADRRNKSKVNPFPNLKTKHIGNNVEILYNADQRHA
jgi:hypothetical protein